MSAAYEGGRKVPSIEVSDRLLEAGTLDLAALRAELGAMLSDDDPRWRRLADAVRRTARD